MISEDELIEDNSEDSGDDRAIKSQKPLTSQRTNMIKVLNSSSMSFSEKSASVEVDREMVKFYAHGD